MIIDFYNRGGGGSGSGVTTGQVKTMISQLAQNYYTATTLSAITNPKEGDVCVIPTLYTEITGITPSYSSFWEVVSGKKIRVDFDATGIANNTFAKYNINNGADYWGFGYSGGTVNTMDEDSDAWITGWSGSNYIHTFPEITRANKIASSSMTTLWQRTHFYEVEDNVTFNYVNGQWIRLMDTISEMIDEGVMAFVDTAQMVYDSDWTGFTPSQIGINEGAIFSNGESYAEVFNGEDAFLERKGFYQRSITATSLSAITGMNEGDVAYISNSGVSWVEVSPSDFVDMLNGDAWQTGICGHTFKFSADTSVSYETTWNLRIVGGDDYYFWGIKYYDSENEYYTYTGNTNNEAWDGSEVTITFPDYADSQSYVGLYPDYPEVVPTNVTILTQQEVNVAEQYSYINGAWAKTYKNVMISQSDYTNLPTKDPNTIYNITGTTA